MDYWFCSERSRLLVCEGLLVPETQRMGEGSTVHSWLEQRPKSRRELELYENLKPRIPFSRTFKGIRIVGHVDDISLLGKNKVQIIEYKTIDKTSVKPWKSLLHKYQVQIYVWVLEPILKELGYNIAHYHSVIYLTRNGVFLKKVSVEQDNFCTERMVKEIFGFWKSGQPLIKPLKWKCLQCPLVFKEQCRIFQGDPQK